MKTFKQHITEGQQGIKPETFYVYKKNALIFTKREHGSKELKGEVLGVAGTKDYEKGDMLSIPNAQKLVKATEADFKKFKVKFKPEYITESTKGKLEIHMGGDPYDGGVVVQIKLNGKEQKEHTQILDGYFPDFKLDNKKYDHYDKFAKAVSKKYGMPVKHVEMK